MARRTIDQKNATPGRARPTALPEEETAATADEQPEPEPRDEAADGTTDEAADAEPGAAPAPESLAVPVEDEDLRIARVPGGAVARQAPRATGPAVPAALMANPVTRFLAESYVELRKVTWPEPGEAWNMALVVIGMSLAVAAVLGAADFGLNHLVTWAISHSAPAGSPTPAPAVPTP